MYASMKWWKNTVELAVTIQQLEQITLMMGYFSY